MEKLIIAMLNEGIDENIICNVIEELKKYQNAKEIKADVDQTYTDFTKSKNPETFKKALAIYKEVLPGVRKYLEQNPTDPKADVIRDSITKDVSNARKKASARADYSVLNCSLSESCFNDIINLVEQFIQESSEE